jgi:serine/threonine-protein kinase RsbW
LLKKAYKSYSNLIPGTMERTLKLRSEIESLRDVEKLIDTIAGEIKLTNEVYGNVLIATLEAANNAIVHGNKLDASKEVTVKVVYERKKLHIYIADQGRGFNYLAIPDPTAPENIENISGRGVFLMEKLSDQVLFTANGAQVELIFSCN